MRVCHFRLPETRHRNSPDRTELNSKSTGYGEKKGVSYLGTKPLGWMSVYWWKDKRTTCTGGERTVRTPSIAAKIRPFCRWEQREQMTAERTLASPQQDSSFTFVCSSSLKTPQLTLFHPRQHAAAGRSPVEDAQSDFSMALPPFLGRLFW